MKILVIGGAGYIGSVLVPWLQKRGHLITVIDLLWFGNHLPTGTTLLQKDAFECTEAEFIGFDCVVFLAGLSNDPMSEFSPRLNFNWNTALPTYLAYIAKQAGCKKFVFASSCSIYGNAPGDFCTELTIPKTTFPYGISKYQAEIGLQQLQSPGFEVTILRMGTVCGASPRMRLDLIMNTMVYAAKSKGNIIVNNPTLARPILAIADAVHSFCFVIEASRLDHSVYNIATANHSVLEIANIIATYFQNTVHQTVSVEIHNNPDLRDYMVNISRAKAAGLLDQVTPLEVIVSDIYQALEKIDNPQDIVYSNIKQFLTVFKG